MTCRSRLAHLAVGVAFFAAVSPALGAPAQITAEKQVKERVVDLTVATRTYATGSTTVEVMLPTGYDAQPTRRWPVTYVLAGTMNRYFSFRTAIKGDKLTASYPSIIVSPDGFSGYWSDWYNGGAFGPPEYETFVIDQLIPLIDQRFRTLADRAHRLIAGVSMGGYGAVMYAARHPDLFSAVGSISGADDSNLPTLGAALSASSTFDGGAVDAIYGPRAEQEIRWRGHNPVDLATNLRDVDVQVRTANGIPNPGIGENLASADSVSCVIEGGVHMGSQSLHDTLHALKVPHFWKDYGPGCHSPANFTRETLDTLAQFSRLLADPPTTPRGFSYRSIEPHFDIYGWHVDADPARALEFLRIDASPGAVTLSGSGRTTVTSPPDYRGLTAVDVNGTTVAPDAAGHVRFSVDLGPPDTRQQYTSGASTTVRTAHATLAAHAVVRLSGVRRRGRTIRVCARARGGVVPVARISAGRASRRVAVGARVRCFHLRGMGAGRVVLRGRDGYGHPVRTTARVR